MDSLFSVHPPEGIDLQSADDGVLVESSILSLEGLSNERLTFLSSANPAWSAGRLHGRQILASGSCCQMLAKRFPKAAFLACQYHHPITLGYVTVELLPSGDSPGSSFLWLKKGDDTLLYASYWNIQNCTTFRKAEFRKARTLFLRLQADPTLDSGINHKREFERLVEFTRKILRAGENLVAVAEPVGEAQRLADVLHEAGFPVYCDDKLYGLMKALEESRPDNHMPSWLGAIQKYTGRVPSPAVILVSKPHLAQQRTRHLPPGIWISTVSPFRYDISASNFSKVTISEKFHLTKAPDMGDILKLLSQIDPQEIILDGHGTTSCMRSLQREGFHVREFQPNHVDTLF